MKRNTWKKTIAFVMAFALVTGGMPVNVGGFLTGGTGIVAHAGGSEPTSEWTEVDSADALYNAVTSNNTQIKLTADIDVSGLDGDYGDLDVSGKTLLLDLNGFSLSTTKDNGAIWMSSGNITITDSSSNKTGAIKSIGSIGYYGIVQKGGSLNITGGTISGTFASIDSMNSAELNVSGGTITGDNIGIYAENQTNINITGGKIKAKSTGIICPEPKEGIVHSPSVNVSGGYITDGDYGIVARSGSVNVTGGFVYGKERGISAEESITAVTITNGEIGGGDDSDDTSKVRGGLVVTSKNCQVTISGGLLWRKKQKAKAYAVELVNTGESVISGGRFRGTARIDAENGDGNNVKVTGGTFEWNFNTANVSQPIIEGGEFWGNITTANNGPIIKGGVYAYEPDSGFIADGHSIVAITDAKHQEGDVVADFEYAVVSTPTLSIEPNTEGGTTKTYDGAGITLTATPSVTTTGASGGVMNKTCNISWTYQWQKKKNDESYENISGATNATYTTDANVADSGTYKCVVTSGGFTAGSTANVTINKAASSITNPPTAISGLKYNGNEQELVTAGTATGGTVEYRDTTLIPKKSSETLAVNDVKIGNVYKPTGDAKISFPTGYAVSFYADTTLNTYTAETNTVYSFKFNGSDTNNPYIEIYKDTAEVSMTYFPGDALLIQAIDQSSKTIMFEVVNSADADNWSTTIPQGSYAGDYTVYYRVNGGDNYVGVAAAQIENVKIEKGNPLKTNPTAKTGLTNRTTPVQLINAGVPQENCKIEYALGTDDQTAPTTGWSENASDITATEKGTFYVWYKVTGNANYADVEATYIPVTVSQYVAPTTSKSSQTWTLTMDSYAYDGTAHTPTINGTTRGTVTYTYYNADTDEELDEAPSAIGNYKVKVYASGNNAYNSRSLIKTYSITDPIDKNGMANVDAFKANGTVPASNGKIFAGWFTDETCTTAYTEKTGKAYAKFIDEKILTVKAQISSGTTASSASTSIRFITSVDSLKYQNVGFKITFNGKTIDQKMTKVYTAINANGAKVKPTVFSADSHYMEAYTLNNIPKDAFGKTFTVTPYYTTQDGTIVEGATNTFTIANMIK